jgi:ATP-dependent Lon protease
MIKPSGFIPVLPLKNTILYPGVAQALRVGREKSIKALQKAFENNNWILTLGQRDPHRKIESMEDLYAIGVLCKIESVRGNPEQGYNVIIRGHERVRIITSTDQAGFFEGLYDVVEDIHDLDEPTKKALLTSLKTLSIEVLKLIPADTKDVEELLSGIEDLSYLTYLAAANADLELSEKQKILEQLSQKERVMHLLTLLQSFRENLKVQADIRQKLTNKIGQSQREQILREQLKTIREELGEGDEASIVDQYRKKIDEAQMPEDAKKLAEQQLGRLEDVNSASPEHHMIRAHLDLMVALPWNKTSEQKEIDLDEAQRILDSDHYGLDEVKKRIIQHLAVMKMKHSQKGSILVLVGPPGVGKTSLGQSIAKATGRKYVRVSVGGVRDDAEIRGHRRTYIGALPGRIISGIKRAGESDPVFILDEIDKLSRSFNGDPASALLEVLDPEQNSAFLDHYLDTGYDLSKVMFILTANSLETIPGPLLDRMEIIEVSGYTLSEKFHIAKKHLIPKQLEEHGLTPEQLAFSDEALHKIISHYTKEAGVRELQRKIASVCRAATEKVIKSDGKPVTIKLNDLEELLGQERFYQEVAEEALEPGVATGMAWTPVGGDILFVEAAMMPGKGDLIITGQLGDVMKESSRIALSLLKARLPYEGTVVDFSKHDIHVHVPAGSIPKDGPSAGVTLLTSLASLLTKRSVSPKLAMTGEVTLRGAVTPVGGIKEKVIAAHRAGVTEIILPEKNRKDLKEVPDEVKSEVKFHFAEHINEVLKIALDFEFPLDHHGEFHFNPALIPTVNPGVIGTPPGPTNYHQ